MQLLEHISLQAYNTFGLDVKARYFVSVSTVEMLQEVLNLKGHTNKFILGGGSNMLLTQDIDALVIHINLKGTKIISETETTVLVNVQAGENWHDFVLWSIDQDFGGIENLSLIPGNVGTAPIQNIGAYGVELKDVMHSCEALEIATGKHRHFSNDECAFGYRNSVFKQALKGQYIITSVNFKLSKAPYHQLKTSYGAIQDALAEAGVETPSIKTVSDAVIQIRNSKLPDPKKIGNSGSFFKNPVISLAQFKTLEANFPTIPSYKISEDQIKVPAGWLIETAGFKGKTFGNYGVHKKQALVLVNYGNAKGEDIYELSKWIQTTVKRLFAIDLEAEVNII